MAIIKTEAIILKRKDLRETSLLVHFFTLEMGKIIGELKGIRKEPRKFASTVEIFSLNEIVVYHSRHSSIHLVSQCDNLNNFFPLRSDIHRIAQASFLMELIDAVMQLEDKNTAIFRLTLETLNALCRTDNPDKIMMICKIKALGLSGFKPHLDSCVSCGSKNFGQIKFSLALGGLLCARCNKLDGGARPILKGTIATIIHIEKNDFAHNMKLGLNPQIKRELDLVLDSFINFHLGRELKSQKTLLKLHSSGAI
jgi:DNA repair protein RecO (recombination protein O)